MKTLRKIKTQFYFLSDFHFMTMQCHVCIMQIKHKTDAHNTLQDQRRHLICLQTRKVLRKPRVLVIFDQYHS